MIGKIIGLARHCPDGRIFECKDNPKLIHSTGLLLMMRWENLADPILTGREELGSEKIYCAVPDPEITATTASVSVNWPGATVTKTVGGEDLSDQRSLR